MALFLHPQFKDASLAFGLLEKRLLYVLREDQAEEGRSRFGAVQEIAVAEPSAELIVRRFSTLATLKQPPHPGEKRI
jgi:hypothetical protein